MPNSMPRGSHLHAALGNGAAGQRLRLRANLIHNHNLRHLHTVRVAMMRTGGVCEMTGMPWGPLGGHSRPLSEQQQQQQRQLALCHCTDEGGMLPNLTLQTHMVLNSLNLQGKQGRCKVGAASVAAGGQWAARTAKHGSGRHEQRLPVSNPWLHTGQVQGYTPSRIRQPPSPHHDLVLLRGVGHLHAPRAANGGVRHIAIACTWRQRAQQQCIIRGCPRVP